MASRFKIVLFLNTLDLGLPLFGPPSILFSLEAAAKKKKIADDVSEDSLLAWAAVLLNPLSVFTLNIA